ncbi:uncharacterized protein Triagg1_10697 [Trichoderma aggressivum f. europaeum]|uniref:mRNA splicing factor RNA helicase n=1 Tax=Trichoderma aggressivum f. europaeum TaxID=173218 RepID=A0AAE1I520_9HYPO|nr:hypothetical protein Triagg1_10697 [Trichoderma aggressivum f. europaeum]
MEPDQDENTPTTEPIRFRAGKKRKAYRQRPTEEKGHDVATVIPAPSVLPGASTLQDGRDATDDANAETQPRDVDMDNSNDDGDDDGDDRMDGESAVAAALRLRNARRAGRRGGVGFRSEGRNQDENGNADAEHALVLRDADRDRDAAHDRIVGGITNRFMHQTGLLTILDDKHMNEYIESRLANRSADPHGTSPSSSQPASHSATNTSFAGGHNNHQDKWRDQPTRHGKLVEVDMANLDSARNNHSSDSNKRRRVEKDAVAKPPPRRGRNRRNSQDVARDALVEQFLHENRLDVYNVPSSSRPTASSAPGADPSADDRLAEEFRQQYYDEQAMRRKKKRPVQQQKQQQQQSGDVLKGPKLGGSRNMRAAVRDKLLQQEKEKKGK